MLTLQYFESIQPSSGYTSTARVRLPLRVGSTWMIDIPHHFTLVFNSVQCMNTKVAEIHRHHITWSAEMLMMN